MKKILFLLLTVVQYAVATMTMISGIKSMISTDE